MNWCWVRFSMPRRLRLTSLVSSLLTRQTFQLLVRSPAFRRKFVCRRADLSITNFRLKAGLRTEQGCSRAMRKLCAVWVSAVCLTLICLTGSARAQNLQTKANEIRAAMDARDFER